MEQKIRTVNKKTGQVFEGTIEEARKFGFSDEFILGKLKTAKELQTAMGGEQPTTVGNIQEALKSTQKLPTGGERTGAQDALIFAEEVQKAINSLSESEKEGVLGAKGSGPLVNLLSGMAETVGVDTKQAALKNRLDNLRQLIRKERTGVQFSPQEVKELEDIFGNISTQEAPLRRKLEDLLSRSVNEASAKTGVDRASLESVFNPTPSPDQSDGGILNSLFGNAKGVLQDVVATPGASAQNMANQNLLQQQEVAQKQVMKAGDIKQLKELQKMFSETSTQSQRTSKQFSSQVQDNPLIRGLLAGSEIASAAEIPSLVKGGASVVKNLFNKSPEIGNAVKGVVMPVKAAGQARRAAATVLEEAGETIGGEGLQKIAQDMLDSKVVTYTEKPLVEALAKGQGVKPNEALDLLVKAGKKAFTKSGDPRITKAADFYAVLRDGLRDQFSSKAPEVIKETTKIAKTLAFRKGAKQAATTIGITAGGVGGGMYLLNLLGGNKNKNY